MGTSKGYIAPKTPEWTSVKRGITSYVKKPNLCKLSEISRRFLRALHEYIPHTSAIRIFSNFASFIVDYQNSGISFALDNIGRNDLIGLPVSEAISTLIREWSDSYSSIDDILALESIAATMDVLDIENHLDELDIDDLLRELICQFAMRKFAQMFDSQIRSKILNPQEADKIIKDTQGYIYYMLKEVLTDSRLSEINPHNLANEDIIIKVIMTGVKLAIEL